MVVCVILNMRVSALNSNVRAISWCAKSNVIHKLRVSAFNNFFIIAILITRMYT